MNSSDPPLFSHSVPLIIAVSQASGVHESLTMQVDRDAGRGAGNVAGAGGASSQPVEPGRSGGPEVEITWRGRCDACDQHLVS